MTEAAADPAEFWEQRYGGVDRVWSGRVNAALAAVVAGIGEPADRSPGSSLDLGCGEGGDVLWLAERGWRATGIDLSKTAVGRAQEEASARGVDATFIAADLGDWLERPAEIDGSAAPFDLVTASFLQSPAHLPRPAVLRAAAARVAAGGRLVLIAHGAPPSWAQEEPSAAAGSGHGQHSHHGPSYFPTPEAELADLDLDPAVWQVEVAEIRERDATGPDGQSGTHFDSVVVCRSSVVGDREIPM